MEIIQTQQIQVQVAQIRIFKLRLLIPLILSIVYIIINILTTPTKKGESQNMIQLPANKDSALLFIKSLNNQNFNGCWKDGKEVKVLFNYAAKLDELKLLIFINLGQSLADDHLKIIFYFDQNMNITNDGKHLKIVEEKINYTSFLYNTNGSSQSHRGLSYLNLEILILDNDINITIQSHIVNYAKKGNQDLEINASYIQFTNPIYNLYIRNNHEINYSFILAVMIILQMYVTLRLQRDVMQQKRNGNGYCIFTVLILASIDGCLGFVHVELIAENMIFLIPSLLFLCKLFIFDINLLTALTKIQYGVFSDQQGVLDLCYYFFMYLTVSINILMLYKYIVYNYLIILISLDLIPQIVYASCRIQKTSFDPLFIFGYVSPHHIIFFYYKGYSNNLLKYDTSFTICITLICIWSGQCFICYLQGQYGQRFFLPKLIVGKTYKYVTDTVIEVDCAVCMISIQESTDQSNLPDQNPNEIMMTPCSHYFHSQCLIQWMNIKQNCPTCRARLPHMEFA